MDEASDLHVASVIRVGSHAPGSVSSLEFQRSFVDDWLKCLPKPQVVRCDVEGCFRGDATKEWLESKMMIRLDMIRGEAPWQVGKHSRHLHTLKTQMTKLAEECPSLTIPELTALSVSAKNELHTKKGFSPNQWAFGQNSDRTFSYLQCYDHLPTLSQHDPSFQANIEVMAKAREVFLRCDAANRLARAVNLKTRKEQELEVGMLVFYFRKGKTRGYKVRGQWHGPARIVFIEKTSEHERGRSGSIIWVAHATVLLRCAPEHVQQVTRDLQAVDTEVNGPFDPGAFMRNRRDYIDLLAERNDLDLEIVDDEDMAWHGDPNDMRLSEAGGHDVELGMKRRRLEFKQPVPKSETEQVDTRPPSHVGDAEPPSQGGSAGPRASRDLHGRNEPSGSGAPSDPQGEERREDLRLGVGERPELRGVGQRAPSSEGAMEGLPRVHREEDDRSREEGQGHELQEAPRAPSGEGREGREQWRRGVELRGPAREDEARSRSGGDHDPGQPVDRDGADARSAPAEHGGREREPDGVSRWRPVRGWRSGRSRTPPPRRQPLGDGENPQMFVGQPLGCEISLSIGPRDVHFDKHGQASPWVVNSKAKKGAEVVFRTLSDEDKERFRGAKQKELDSYLQSMAVDVAKRQGVDPHRVLGMRWILTWKTEKDEQGNVTGKKAKARLIIKGFEDPDLMSIQRDSPTLSTLGRNLLLSEAARRNWGVKVGDIKTAFLNGDATEYDREIYGDPPEDVREMMGLREKELFRIRKAVYGLLNAPRRWIDKLAKELKSSGWVRSRLEPCTWCMYVDGRMTGLIGVHVDDVLICGEGPEYDSKVQTLLSTFPFGSWKDARKERITFCGAELSQEADGTLRLNQERYALGINEINLTRERKLQEEEPATEHERKAMKGVLGALSWRANQTAPWLSATTSILQGKNAKAKVKDLLDTNKLVRLQRACAGVELVFTPHVRDPLVLTFSDASHANREDGTSQGATITVLTDKRVLDGGHAPFSILSWHSKKLKRIARSSTCAEVQACANAYDDNEFIRQILCDWQCEEGISARTSDESISLISAAVVCDAKNMYDSVNRTVSSGLQLGEEKRLSLEVLTIRERAEATNAPLRWLDSDQQLADDLTKSFCVDKLLHTMRSGQLAITWDPDYVSAKRKRQARWKAQESRFG